MEILGIKMFDLLIDSIGAIGVTGLDRYFGFCIVKELQAAVGYLNSVRLRRRKGEGRRIVKERRKENEEGEARRGDGCWS
jgi:hypothetical protein